MRAVRVLAAVVLLACVPAGAAQQPATAPEEFRNGQENGFGRVELPPYARTQGGQLRVEARITLHDLDALGRAATVMVALNLLGDGVRLGDAALTAGGQPVAPTRTDTARGGLQVQGFYAPADLLRHARGGAVELVLAAPAEATANGQWHVGALVIAFDAAWGTLRASDGGPAELYGFTLLMATGLPGSPLRPFQGQGNTLAALPILAIALVATAAGGLALSAALRDWRVRRAVAGSAPPSGPPAAPPGDGAADASAADPAALPVFGAPATGAAAEAPGAAAVPTFGAPAPPPSRQATGRLPPVQGPKLPPGFVPRPWSAVPALADAAEAGAVATHSGTLRAKPGARRRSPSRAAGPDRARGRRGAQPSR